jgi:hypothetical protein
MKFKGHGTAMWLCVGMLAVAGCSQQAGEGWGAAGRQTQPAKLEINEVVVRPAGETTNAAMRPTRPNDVVEVAIKTKGATSSAELSVKMIALANGEAVGQQNVRLNASNAAAPIVRFTPSPQWETGRYLFEVSLDGKLAGSQELEIFPAEVAGPAKD